MNNDKNPGLFHNALKGLPYSALSWNGMNLFGDTASIKEAASALHALSVQPELRQMLAEASRPKVYVSDKVITSDMVEKMYQRSRELGKNGLGNWLSPLQCRKLLESALG